MRFDGRNAGLLHGVMEMDGDVEALVGAHDGANDLCALSGSGGVGNAGVGEDDFESLADPVARTAGGEHKAVTGDVDGAADFLKGFDSAYATADENRGGEFGAAATAALAGLAGGVSGSQRKLGSEVDGRAGMHFGGRHDCVETRPGEIGCG